jgi:hypothetical protein
LLASCDNIEAKLPTADYNAPILNVTGTTNNALGKIYDALITEGDTNSAKVLNERPLSLRQSIYGDFFTMKKGRRAIRSEQRPHYRGSPSLRR